MLDEEDLLFNVSKSKAAFGQQRSVSSWSLIWMCLSADTSEEALMEILTQGKVAIIYKGDIFIGFITKVDLINHYRTKISQD